MIYGMPSDVIIYRSCELSKVVWFFGAPLYKFKHLKHNRLMTMLQSGINYKLYKW